MSIVLSFHQKNLGVCTFSYLFELLEMFDAEVLVLAVDFILLIELIKSHAQGAWDQYFHFVGFGLFETFLVIIKLFIFG